MTTTMIPDCGRRRSSVFTSCTAIGAEKGEHWPCRSLPPNPDMRAVSSFPLHRRDRIRLRKRRPPSAQRSSSCGVGASTSVFLPLRSCRCFACCAEPFLRSVRAATAGFTENTRASRFRAWKTGGGAPCGFRPDGRCRTDRAASRGSISMRTSLPFCFSRFSRRCRFSSSASPLRLPRRSSPRRPSSNLPPLRGWRTFPSPFLNGDRHEKAPARCARRGRLPRDFVAPEAAALFSVGAYVDANPGFRTRRIVRFAAVRCSVFDTAQRKRPNGSCTSCHRNRSLDRSSSLRTSLAVGLVMRLSNGSLRTARQGLSLCATGAGILGTDPAAECYGA